MAKGIPGTGSNASTGQPDGFLPAARTRLADAISALCDPVMHLIDNKRFYCPSWYRQLQDAKAGKRSTGSGSSKPITELWLDAVMLLDEVDMAVSAWQQTGGTTPERLHLIEARSWRPQDCHSIDQISDNLHAWVKQIASLLSNEARLSLPNPCPECEQKTAWHRDSGGELVRGDALQVSVAGAECLACHATWRRDELTFLGRLLDYEPPAGVLE